MKHLKKALIILVLGIVIILARNYETKQSIKISQNSSTNAELIRVVDGDTIIARVNNIEERIRIIGINTPESVRPNSPVECFGRESSEYISQLFSNDNKLRIKSDPTQDARDRNGRLLAHVFLNNINIAQQMIMDGYGYEYTYREPYIYQSEYKNAERIARENNRGLWSPETCNGQK